MGSGVSRWIKLWSFAASVEECAFLLGPGLLKVSCGVFQQYWGVECQLESMEGCCEATVDALYDVGSEIAARAVGELLIADDLP